MTRWESFPLKLSAWSFPICPQHSAGSSLETRPCRTSVTCSGLTISHRVCLAVSKSWRAALSKDSALWKELIFDAPKNPRRDWKNYLYQRRQATALIIRDARKFEVNPSKFATVCACLPRLTTLHIARRAVARSPWDISDIPPRIKATHLTCLSLANLPESCDRTIAALLTSTQENLESLAMIGLRPHFTSTGHSSSLYFWNAEWSMPKLKILHLDMCLEKKVVLRMVSDWALSTCRLAYSADHGQPRLARATPNLEQLFLDNFDFCPESQPPSVEADLGPFWSKLRVLSLGSGTTGRGDCIPPLSGDLRTVEILTTNPQVTLGVFRSILDSTQGHTPMTWPNLAKLRVRASLRQTDRLAQIVKPAVDTGTLEVLDIGLGFNHAVGSDDMNAWLTIPQKAFDFTVSDSIHSLGLSDFSWEAMGADGRLLLDPKPFLDWLDCYRHVQTVFVYPNDGQDSGRLVAALIRRRVKTIFVQEKVLFERENRSLRDLARDSGVKLIGTKEDHGPPLCWPPFRRLCGLEDTD